MSLFIKNLINTMKIDKKLHRFKQLMSYTLATTPALIIPALSYYFYKNTPDLGVGTILLGIFAIVCIAKGHEYEQYEGRGGINILKSSFWYGLINTPTQKIVQRLGKKLIKEIKNSTDPNFLTSLYVECHAHQTVIEDWYNYHINSSKHSKEEKEKISISGYFPYNDKFKFKQILKYLSEDQISKKDIEQMVNTSFSHLDLAIKNNKYDLQRARLLIRTGRYTLTENDYKGIQSLFEKEDLSLLELLFHNSANNIDWPRLQQIFKDSYPNLDHSHEKYSIKFKELITEPEHQNKQVLRNINKIKAHESTVFNQALNYNPQHYADTWGQLVGQCDILSKNEFLLSIEDKTNFQEQLKNSLPAIVQADTYLSSLKDRGEKSEVIMKKMKVNLDQLLSQANCLVQGLEYNLEKSLDIASKVTKPQQMSASK